MVTEHGTGKTQEEDDEKIKHLGMTSRRVEGIFVCTAVKCTAGILSFNFHGSEKQKGGWRTQRTKKDQQRSQTTRKKIKWRWGLRFVKPISRNRDSAHRRWTRSGKKTWLN